MAKKVVKNKRIKAFDYKRGNKTVHVKGHVRKVKVSAKSASKKTSKRKGSKKRK